MCRSLGEATNVSVGSGVRTADWPLPGRLNSSDRFRAMTLGSGLTQPDPFRTITPSESGHSRVRFDYEHPRLLSLLTFGLDRRIPLGVVEG
jgi:hypothetical protein